jgi:trans-2,3-dihydro-3-hydroxyanthranilate isomerase
MRARYLLVDVFTDRPFAGNALAVFPDGHAVPPHLMQSIAREMNLSETTFVTRATAESYDVRIFTPGSEMPFAGHPTLGTAWALRHLGLVGERTVQRSSAGDTPVSIAFDTVWLERAGNVGPDIDDVSFVAHALGIAETDIGFSASQLGMERIMLAPAIADSGLPQLMVPIADAQTLASIEPRAELTDLATDVVYCFAPVAPTKVKARGFAPGVGVQEDPATGSAAAGLGLYLSARAGDLAFDISQGDEVGRPSTLIVVTARGRVRVGGSVVLAGEGELVLPGA